MNSASDPVKIHFKLEQDEEGYPPVDWESLWATPVGEALYMLDNTPFYARGVSSGDTVTAVAVNGRLEFTTMAAPGGHATVRVVAFDEHVVPELRASLKRIGCSSEVSNLPALLAVDVPPVVDYARVMELIESYAASGSIDYEESSIQH